MGLPEAMASLGQGGLEALANLKATSQGYLNPGVPITSDLAPKAPLPELGSLGTGQSSGSVLANVRDILPDLSSLEPPAAALSASEAEIAAEWAAALRGASPAAAGLVDLAPGLVEGAVGLGAGLAGLGAALSAPVSVPIAGLSILAAAIVGGVVGFFAQSANKSVPAKYVGRKSPVKEFGTKGDHSKSATLFCLNDRRGKFGAAVGISFLSYSAPVPIDNGVWGVNVIRDRGDGVIQALFPTLLTTPDNAVTVPLLTVEYSDPVTTLPSGVPAEPNQNPPLVPQQQSPNQAAAAPLRNAFPGFPVPANPSAPLPTRPPVIEPAPPRITYPGSVPNPPEGTRMRDPNTGATLDRQPSPNPQNPAQPDPTGKGTTTGSDPNTGFTTIVPKDDAGTTSGKTEVTQSGTAGCRFQNTNLAGVAQQVTSVAIQTAVAAVQTRADQIKDDTVETLKRIGSGLDPGESDRPKPQNLTALVATVRDEVGMRRSRKGRKGKSLVSLGEMSTDIQERVGFTTATSTKKCDVAKTLENVEDATKDIRERTGFDKKITKKRAKRDKDGNVLRDEKTGDKILENKSYCSLSEAIEGTLDEPEDQPTPEAVFVTGFPVRAPKTGRLKILFNDDRFKIVNKSEIEVPNPKPNPDRATILKSITERETGEWYCTLELITKDGEGRHQLTGWFKSEQIGKAYLERLSALSLSKVNKVDGFSATNRPGKQPEGSKGKKLYPVRAYVFAGDSGKAKLATIDLRPPKPPAK